MGQVQSVILLIQTVILLIQVVTIVIWTFILLFWNPIVSYLVWLVYKKSKSTTELATLSVV